jgi:hypothetical protein
VRIKGRYLSIMLVMFLMLLGSMVIWAEEAKIQNPSFEQDELEGEVLPAGWLLFTAPSDKQKVELTKGKAVGGSYSLLLTDRDANKSLGLRSTPIPIVGGASYKGEAYVFIPDLPENDKAGIYLEFWDASGDTRLQAHSLHITEKGYWFLASLTKKAPDDAAYATLLLYSFGPNVTQSYFDDVSIARVN